MSHKFSVNFKFGWITRRGPNLLPEGQRRFRGTGKYHPGRHKCYEYIIKPGAAASHDDVQLLPIRHVKVQELLGPATRLDSRTIIYGCSRGKCQIPCPCMLCDKKHLRCRAGQSCGCYDCRKHFSDHVSFHSCLHQGCRFCHSIVQVIPHCNFFLLDTTRKPTNNGVSSEEQLVPTCELPGDFRADMMAQFLKREKWEEKLKNWHSGILDDGTWCVGCSTMFFDRDMYRDHILNNHNTSKIFRHNYENASEAPQPTLQQQCDQCHKTFVSRRALERHNECVHYQERYECPSCDLTFSRKDHFHTHNSNKHIKPPIICKTCGIKFKDYFAWERHTIKDSCSALICSICQKIFSSASALRRHTIEKCNDEKKVYVLGCDICETTFIRRADLMKHKKNSLNADGSSKFVCSICGEKVCNRKLLKMHIRRVHGSDKTCLETSLSQEDDQVKTSQIFECDLCEKTFSRKDSLFIHKTTHKTNKSFTCEHCLTEFSLKKNFVRHQKESLDKEGNLRHECPICDKSFCTERFLTAHMKFGHAEEFICTVCKQKFSSKYHLERHHITKTSFACEECKEYFCHKRGFSKHMKVVHLM